VTGDTIKEWRISKGLTQGELGKLCGVGKSSVSQWESLATEPSGAARVILEDFIAGRRAIIQLTGLEERLLNELVRMTHSKSREEYLEQALLKAIRESEQAPISRVDIMGPNVIAEVKGSVVPFPHTIIRRGSVAAGGKSSADVEEEDMPSSKNYPSTHYALRVLGQSMEPTIPDGSLIVVKAFKDQGFPKKGSIVVYNDGYGATLKLFDYRKAEEGDEHQRLGKIPVLKSINPDFPDVETLEGGRIDAVFVEILE
jgi:transcriptional regulator with XRE-family HTH domain